jgi:hypothetical protein
MSPQSKVQSPNTLRCPAMIFCIHTMTAFA